MNKNTYNKSLAVYAAFRRSDKAKRKAAHRKA